MSSSLQFFICVILTFSPSVLAQSTTTAYESPWDEGVIGVGTVDIPDDRQLEIEDGLIRFRSRGAFVVNVFQGGPAAAAGLKVGDLIERVGKQRVTDSTEFLAAAKEQFIAGVPLKIRGRRLKWAEGKGGELRGSYGKKSATIELVPIARGDLLKKKMTPEMLYELKCVRWRHSDSPAFTGPTGIDAWYTVGTESKEVSPRINIRYRGDDWIFWKSAYIVVDGKTYNFEYGHFDVSKDHGSGSVWEWSHVHVGESEEGKIAAALCADLCDAKDVRLVLIGKDYREQHDLTRSEVQRIEETLQSAKLAGWKPQKDD